jgi:hypothetical protein
MTLASSCCDVLIELDVLCLKFKEIDSHKGNGSYLIHYYQIPLVIDLYITIQFEKFYYDLENLPRNIQLPHRKYCHVRSLRNLFLYTRS